MKIILGLLAIAAFALMSCVHLVDHSDRPEFAKYIGQYIPAGTDFGVFEWEKHEQRVSKFSLERPDIRYPGLAKRIAVIKAGTPIKLLAVKEPVGFETGGVIYAVGEVTITELGTIVVKRWVYRWRVDQTMSMPPW